MPVSVCYDLTFEEATGSGDFSFWKFLKLWIGLRGSGGSARVDLDQPFSVKELIKTINPENEAINCDSFIYSHLR